MRRVRRRCHHRYLAIRGRRLLIRTSALHLCDIHCECHRLGRSNADVSDGFCQLDGNVRLDHQLVGPLEQPSETSRTCVFKAYSIVSCAIYSLNLPRTPAATYQYHTARVLPDSSVAHQLHQMCSQNAKILQFNKRCTRRIH